MKVPLEQPYLLAYIVLVWSLFWWIARFPWNSKLSL